MFQLKLTRPIDRKKVAYVAIVVVVLLIGIPTIGHLPVHRTSFVYEDVQADVSDPDFDIIQVKSYAQTRYIVLELTVAGLIQTSDSEFSDPNHLYRITVVARGVDRGVHIYSCKYQSGVIEQYGFDFQIVNSTLRIFFPFTAFVSDSYMIGLEGSAQYTFDRDLTPEDRDSPLARLLF
ncbi:MAG: hypothetical protein JW779_07140 [Candidatus Thorarchaeota archaeon]|nr:hypothetical protein [Candidatus Thorarchaeota archaeon]